MEHRSSLRASDADREQVAERLHQAATEGRLTADELDDRMHHALTARTYGELEPLVKDLPGSTALLAPKRPQTSGMAIASLILGVLWLRGMGSLGALLLGLLATREIKNSARRLPPRRPSVPP